MFPSQDQESALPTEFEKIQSVMEEHLETCNESTEILHDD